MYPLLNLHQPSFSTMVILSSIVHLLVLSTILYPTRSPKRFFITPVYTVDLVTPPADIKKALTVKKVGKKHVHNKTDLTVKSSPKKKITVARKVTEAPSTQKPTKTEKVEEAKLIDTAIEKTKERDRLRAEETRLQEAFKGLKAEGTTQETDKLQGAIARIEGKRRLTLKEFEIKKEFSRIREKETFGGKVVDISPKPILPGLKKEETKTPDKFKEDMERKFKERGAEIREAFKGPKEREKTRKEGIKEIIKEKEGIRIPDYEPREWNLELKGAKGLLAARLKRGTISTDLLDIKFKNYYRSILEKVQDSWILPENVEEDSKELETIVAIKIKRDGGILKIEIEKVSGNEFFDRSALRAVEKSSPLQPLPEEYTGTTLEVGLRFCPPWANCK